MNISNVSIVSTSPTSERITPIYVTISNTTVTEGDGGVLPVLVEISYKNFLTSHTRYTSLILYRGYILWEIDFPNFAFSAVQI